ncbi:hypothetical protein D3C84_467440 [compost metagenome]
MTGVIAVEHPLGELEIKFSVVKILDHVVPAFYKCVLALLEQLAQGNRLGQLQSTLVALQEHAFHAQQVKQHRLPGAQTVAIVHPDVGTNYPRVKVAHFVLEAGFRAQA